MKRARRGPTRDGAGIGLAWGVAVDARSRQANRRAVGAGIVLVVCASILGSHPMAAQDRGRATPPLVIASMSGRDLFDFYCASCHGRDGHGQGPVASSLKVPPADLTTLARRSDGVFPRAAVRAFVTGDQPQATSSHGTKDMPVWGPVFNGLEANPARNAVRIDNIVRHIETLQAH